MLISEIEAFAASLILTRLDEDSEDGACQLKIPVLVMVSDISVHEVPELSEYSSFIFPVKNAASQVIVVWLPATIFSPPFGEIRLKEPVPVILNEPLLTSELQILSMSDTCTNVFDEDTFDGNVQL